ncbi:MAG: TrkH family potassium uptake protein [Coriobacteriia bacterium]|nr:TrkH family potassium uptake protein [Coriobacteriia bacterium]MCL2749785.1 TrkH family potassium uptake protein [Coriobacteriia bacterium]
MWYRFNRDDLRIIAHYLGLLMMTFGAIMAVPLAVSIIYAEWAVTSHYIFGMGVALLLGTLLRLAKIEPQSIKAKHAIAITGMIWIVGAILAAVPLYLSGHYANFLDAIFEGVSGLTATGLSLAQDVDHMSMADNMWRFTMQFVGGQGVVVVALSLGIFTRTGNKLYTSEAREESVVPNVKKTARFILQFSTAAVIIGTIVSTIILVFIGVEPLRGFFHGLWITIGAYDTGGFAPVSLSLIPYHSWPLEIVAMIFMMLGAISFAVIAQVHKGNWREFVRDIEVRTLALWTIGMVVVFVAALAAGNFLTEYSGLLRRGIFTIISATTNTGFQVLTNTQITALLPSGALLLLVVSMAIGGSSASTAGGIKALRVGLVFKGIGLHVRRILQPRSAQVTSYYNHIGRHQLTPELLSAALIIAALYVISYVLGILVGIAYGYEALHATFESISAASNVGLSSGIVQVGMPVPLEIFYMLQMWFGRLEFITLLALFAGLFASLLPKRKPKTSSRSTLGNLLGTKEHHTKEHNKKGSVGARAVVLLAAIVAATLAFAPLASASPEPDSLLTPLSGSVPLSGISDTVPQKEVTVTELTGATEGYEDSLVVFEGEVVGDRINADKDHVWITLSDGNNAITVLLPREFEELIQHYGSYAYEGTHLRIVGEFSLACSQHQGANDVHAASVVAVIDPGHARESQPNLALIAGGVALIAAAVGLFALYGYLSRKRR